MTRHARAAAADGAAAAAAAARAVSANRHRLPPRGPWPLGAPPSALPPERWMYAPPKSTEPTCNLTNPHHVRNMVSFFTTCCREILVIVPCVSMDNPQSTERPCEGTMPFEWDDDWDGTDNGHQNNNGATKSEIIAILKTAESMGRGDQGLLEALTAESDEVTLSKGDSSGYGQYKSPHHRLLPWWNVAHQSERHRPRWPRRLPGRRRGTVAPMTAPALTGRQRLRCRGHCRLPCILEDNGDANSPKG